MKRMLYISHVDYGSQEHLGVIKKIDVQKNALSKAGYQIDHLKLKGNDVYVNTEHVFSFRNKVDYWIRLPLQLQSYFAKNTTPFYELVYVRKTFFNPLYYFLFKRLQAGSNYILLEVPTYPYTMELQGGWRRIISLMDSLNNFFIRKKLFRVITTQDYPKILGVDTIQIKNGYDFSIERPIKRNRMDNAVRLITVANFNFWHGIDRLFYGLKNYNDHTRKKVNIVIHLVGGGKELPNLKRLAAKLKLDNLIFHGPKYGTALDEVYANADIGVGVLGLYRKGLDFTSSLKNMEYAYYGLPFIIGNQDKDIQDCKFVLRVPNDNSPINFNEVIDWFGALDVSPDEIRNKGKELYSWDKQVGIILNSLG